MRRLSNAHANEATPSGWHVWAPATTLAPDDTERLPPTAVAYCGARVAGSAMVPACSPEWLFNDGRSFSPACKECIELVESGAIRSADWQREFRERNSEAFD